MIVWDELRQGKGFLNLTTGTGDNMADLQQSSGTRWGIVHSTW